MGYVSGQAEDGHQPAVTLINARSHCRNDVSRVRFSPQTAAHLLEHVIPRVPVC